MHSTFSWHMWLVWLLTFVGQAIVLIRALRTNSLLVFYLAPEMGLSVVGLFVALAMSARAYFNTWVVASIVDDALTAVLLFRCFEVLRCRARRHWQGCWLIAGPAAVLAFAALYFAHLPLSELVGNTCAFSVSATHVSWTWLALLFAFVPVYCALTGSFPDRTTLLVLLGAGLYIAVNAGVTDYLVSNRLAHHAAANFVSNCSYFFSLVLWLVSTKAGVQRNPREITP